MHTKILSVFAAVVALGTVGARDLRGQQAAAPATPPPAMVLTTAAFADGGEIPAKYSCTVKDEMSSPALQWSGAPKETVSFALIVHDPDAHPAKGMSDVTHWILWNIPATATQLPAAVPGTAALQDGTQQGKNVRGANAYQGPCPPPSKPHHYVFELLALDEKVDLPAASATRADLLKAVDGHVIASAAYVGTFHR